jgi:peptidoglycan/LPS O-acetylase OafA/YrhL
MKLNRLQSLDVIRGIAAISVFLYHFGTAKLPKLHQLLLQFQSSFLWCNQGLHWGVIVFVVLSGFSIHMKNTNRDTLNTSQYLKRRLLRIVPVLIFAIIFGYFVDFYFYHRVISDYAYNFFSNIFLLTGFLPIEPPYSNTILNTAIVEILIYLSYPFILQYFKKNKLAIILIILLIHMLNFGLIFTNINPSWIGRNFFALSLYWWIGALFAELTFNTGGQTIKYKKIFQGGIPLFVGYLIYYLSSHFINFQGSHVFKSICLAIISGILIATIVDLELSSKYKMKFFGFQYIGTVAYSLYAIHFPIILFLNSFLIIKRVPLNNQYCIIWLAVIVMTLLTYFFIEKPFHKMARK